MLIDNHIRGYAYLFGVLHRQQGDQFCGKCKAFVNTVVAARMDLEAFEQVHASDIKGLSAELQRTLRDAKNASNGLILIENAVGQKKAGNCKLPEGVCFVKSARALLRNLSPVSNTE